MTKDSANPMIKNLWRDGRCFLIYNGSKIHQVDEPKARAGGKIRVTTEAENKPERTNTWHNWDWQRIYQVTVLEPTTDGAKRQNESTRPHHPKDHILEELFANPSLID